MNRWKVLAIALLILVALELVWIYAHWSLIVTAYNNRKIISDAGDIVAGAAAIKPLLSDIKSIF